MRRAGIVGVGMTEGGHCAQTDAQGSVGRYESLFLEITRLVSLLLTHARDIWDVTVSQRAASVWFWVMLLGMVSQAALVVWRGLSLRDAQQAGRDRDLRETTNMSYVRACIRRVHSVVSRAVWSLQCVCTL